MICVTGSEGDDSSETALLVQGQCLPVAQVSLHCTPGIRVRISKIPNHIVQGSRHKTVFPVKEEINKLERFQQRTTKIRGWLRG